MEDGTIWDIPIEVIAKDYAYYLAYTDDADSYDVLDDEVISIFEEDHKEILEWLSGDMDWDAVESVAELVQPSLFADPSTYNEGITNGFKEIV